MRMSDDPPPSGNPTASTTLTSRAATNGHGDMDPPGASRRRGPLPGPSTRPALVVLGIIAALFVTGFVVDTLSSGPHPTSTSHPLTTASGAPLHAVPAGPLLDAIVSQGQPPTDIVHAVAAPAGATAVPDSSTNRGVELYDRSVRIQVAASQQDVIGFFRAQLPFMHWTRLSEGPKNSDYQLLFQHPGSDGHEWEVGVTVSPTQFPVTGGTARGTTTFTVRLFAEADQQ
jgi:hypothetical protein